MFRSTRSRRFAAAAALAAVAAAGVLFGAGAVGFSATQADVANLWVDTSGGTCARSATSVAYNDAQACGSLNAAYQKASPGDVIEVQGGAYSCAAGMVNAKPGAAAPNVQMTTPAGQTPSFLGCQDGLNDDWNGSYLTITGHFEWSSLQVTNSTNLTLDGVEIDSAHNFDQSLVVQCATSNFVMRNSSIHGAYNGWMVGVIRCGAGSFPNGVTFDHVKFYDNRMSASNTSHLECLGDWGGDNLTVTNSDFRHCTQFDIFLSTANDGSNYPAHNVTLTNNTFADSFLNYTDGGCCSGYTVKWLTGNPNSGRWGATVIRHNTFEGLLYLANGNAGSTLNVTGNILENDVDACQTGTWANNIGAKCGATDIQSTQAAISAGFVTDNQTSMSNAGDDYHLKSTSPAVGKGESSPIPATDQDGNTRKSPSDAGAFELGGMPPPPPPTTTTVPTTTTTPAGTTVTVTTTVPGPTTTVTTPGPTTTVTSTVTTTVPGPTTTVTVDSCIPDIGYQDCADEIISLKQDKSILQQELDQANSDKAALQAQLDAANNTIAAIKAWLATAPPIP